MRIGIPLYCALSNMRAIRILIRWSGKLRDGTPLEDRFTNDWRQRLCGCESDEFPKWFPDVVKNINRRKRQSKRQLSRYNELYRVPSVRRGVHFSACFSVSQLVESIRASEPFYIFHARFPQAQNRSAEMVELCVFGDEAWFGISRMRQPAEGTDLNYRLCR